MAQILQELCLQLWMEDYEFHTAITHALFQSFWEKFINLERALYVQITQLSLNMTNFRSIWESLSI